MNFLKIKDFSPKTLIITLLFALIFTSGIANNPKPLYYLKNYLIKVADCDACGCASSGGNLGMGGVIENNFVGVRYLFQKYNSKDGIFKNSPKIDEYFNTVQIWSRIPIVEKLEVQAFVPYHFHSRSYVDKKTAIKGLGDISLLANYTLLNNLNSNYNEVKNKVTTTNHLLKVGLGIKMPTGKYDVAINNSINPSFQLGTGSVDYFTNMQYVFKYNRMGVTNYLNYYLKTKNNKGYKFGNQLNFSSTFFYVLKNKKQHSFVPSLGVSGEFYQSNQQFDIDVKRTKGNALFSNIGLEYNTEKITVGALAIFPVQQKLAGGIIKIEHRISLYANYNF